VSETTLRKHDDEQANVLAAAFVRDEIPAGYREQMLAPENIPALYDALTTLVQDIDSQFAERRASAQDFQNRCHATGDKQGWFEYKADYDRWRAGAQRFKASADRAKRDVKRRMASQRTSREAQHLEASAARDERLTLEAQVLQQRKTLNSPGANARLRQENHRLRTALAILLERYDVLGVQIVEDWEMGADDAPFVRLERTEDDEGWRVEVERRQG
jgi:hypothetical protein